MKLLRSWLGVALALIALVEFLFWGGNGIGLSLFFLILLGAYYLATGFKVSSSGRVWHIVFLGIIVLLATTYSLFDNEPLRVINFMGLVFMGGLLFLQPLWEDGKKWDSVTFQLEQFVGYFVRPFVAIASPWTETSKGLAGHRSNDSKKKHPIVGQILLGLIIALPVVVVLAVLLSSSDKVFADFLQGIFRGLFEMNITTLAIKILVALLCLPFVASTIWSYKNGWRLTTAKAESQERTGKKIPTALAGTMLVLINILYACYGVIQFVYLFGGRLPQGLSYADYARSGFFELSFVALLNFFLLLVCLYGIQRQGRGNLVIRLLSMLLVVLSSVQLVSAFVRMNLYVQAYGLSQLRFFVLAFMGLVGIWFILFVIKEWKSSYPLFKSVVVSSLLLLLLVNYSVPDRLIAKYNIDNYLAGNIESLDISYIMNNLSADSNGILWDSKDELIAKDPILQVRIDEFAEYKQSQIEEGRGTWKDLNLSRCRSERDLPVDNK